MNSNCCASLLGCLEEGENRRKNWQTNKLSLYSSLLVTSYQGTVDACATCQKVFLIKRITKIMQVSVTISCNMW